MCVPVLLVWDKCSPSQCLPLARCDPGSSGMCLMRAINILWTDLAGAGKTATSAHRRTDTHSHLHTLSHTHTHTHIHTHSNVLVPITPPTDDDRKEKGREKEREKQINYEQRLSSTGRRRPPASPPTYLFFPPTRLFFFFLSSPNSACKPRSIDVMSHSSLCGSRNFPVDTSDSTETQRREREETPLPPTSKRKWKVAVPDFVNRHISHTHTHSQRVSVIMIKGASLSSCWL